MVGGQHHAAASLPPGTRPCAHLWEAGWAPGAVWTGAENLAPTRIRSPDRTSRYTDYTIPVHTHGSNSLNYVVYCMEWEKFGDIWFVFRIWNVKWFF